MKHQVSEYVALTKSLTHVPIRTISIAPSAYHTEKVVLKNKQPPAYSFGIKSKPVKSNDTPCKCKLPRVGDIFYCYFLCFNGVNYGLHIIVIFVSIAPNAYRPEKPMHTPRYSFGIKVNHEKASDTPGKYIHIMKNKLHSPSDKHFMNAIS